ncbi:MAG: hypothetical protein RI988_3436 [Pseudomonadota bacterium]|jgi:hypothetical protein
MAVYLDTRGRSTLGIGLCARCSRKFSLDDLQSDPNFPGLMVCEADLDDFDPYRLPARETEQITLRFVRPDESIATDPAGVISEDGNIFLVTEDFEEFLLP